MLRSHTLGTRVPSRHDRPVILSPRPIEDIPMTQHPPAGWHTAPNMPGHERWWNGESWTDNVRPASPPTNPSSATPQPPSQLPPPAPDRTTTPSWWERRSGLGKAMTIVGGFFVAVLALGAILPDVEPTSGAGAATGTPAKAATPPAGVSTSDPGAPASQAPSEPATPSASPTAASPAPTGEPADVAASAPPPVVEETPASDPTTDSRVGAPGAIPARLVLDDDPGASIQAFRDVEESLAEIIIDAVDQEAWWPYVGEVAVDEDLFQSDVRLRLDVLMHPDVVPTAVAMCEAVVAFLPETDESIAVYVQPTSPSAGGQEIDGSDEAWTMGHSTLIRGSNTSSRTCQPNDPTRSEVERTEQFITEER